MVTPSQPSPARRRVIAYNNKHMADHEATFRALTGAGAEAVRVAAPLFSPSLSGTDAMTLTGCTCNRMLCQTRPCDDKGHCHTPGKHPLGDGWQNYGTTDWDKAKGWLLEGLNLGYLAKDRVIGIDFDDTSKIGTIFPAGIPTDTLTDEVEGRPHVWLRVPDGVGEVKDVIPALFDGGEVARAGSRMLVAPVALHAHGARRRWNGVSDVAVATDDTIERLIAAKRANRERQEATPGQPGYKVTAGGRHAFMDSQAGTLRNVLTGEDALLAALRAANAERCEPPIEDDYLQRLAHDYAVNKEGLPPPVTLTLTVRQEEVVIDPLIVADFSAQPPPELNRDTMEWPVGMDALLQHYERVTDAGWAPLALTTLVSLGALYGPRPMLSFKGDHRVSLFGMLVGDSGIGRKTTTMNVVGKTLSLIDPELPLITHRGFGSGEVMIDTLADSTRRTGVPAMLIEEQELATLLIVSERQGATLSGTMRAMYDGSPVSAKSRKSGSVTAHGYHVGMIAGITPQELSKRLTADALTNGWANRMLWFWSERRSALGKYDDEASVSSLDPGIAKYIAASIDFARTLPGLTILGAPVAGGATMTLDDGARDYLRALFVATDVKQVGVAGVVRSRMLPNIIRMAMIGALMDCSSVVDTAYVRFGQQMAEYAVQSVKAVFGERVDDPVAMYIVSLLDQAPGGWLNTTDLKQGTGRDYPRVQSALRVLLATGLVVREDRPAKGNSGGKPSVGFRLRKQ